MNAACRIGISSDYLIIIRDVERSGPTGAREIDIDEYSISQQETVRAFFTKLAEMAQTVRCSGAIVADNVASVVNAPGADIYARRLIRARNIDRGERAAAQQVHMKLSSGIFVAADDLSEIVDFPRLAENCTREVE